MNSTRKVSEEHMCVQAYSFSSYLPREWPVHFKHRQ